MIDAVASGDKQAVKHELETILAFSQKTTSALSQAFELLLALMGDDETRSALARFPYDYIEAHSYVDKERLTGVMAFEILLALLTGGTGAAASAASKSKHLANAHRSLVETAEILKRDQLNKTISHTVSPEQPKLIEHIAKPDATLQPGTTRGVTTQVSAKKTSSGHEILHNEFIGTFRGQKVLLKDIDVVKLNYKRRDRTAYGELRKKFDSSIRKNYLKSMAEDPNIVKALKAAGFSEKQIQMIKNGYVPKGYNVHHKIPLDDGGTNDFDNLILIRNNSEHYTITNAQRELTSKIPYGKSVEIEFPVPPGFLYPPKGH
ncbi:HNH endonuclease signature motif containing protein [Pseudoalteromonas sp. NEC-BIFX-2020_015]|uniref:HNH endonuclease signature motif containing protein n=1 Tax=Pseudoalteromonas sp. NEC-BIFX-2020_015 TaxID=2729544 RepID=UPI001BA48C87|nr:HNH endonuclease signature motif containing protein [Pseudoalteromonas sp. NEC-BIFX-2020_015]